MKKSKEAASEVYKNGLAYQCLLKNELLGAEIEDINEYRQSEERKAFTPLVNRNVFRVSKSACRSQFPMHCIICWQPDTLSVQAHFRACSPSSAHSHLSVSPSGRLSHRTSYHVFAISRSHQRTTGANDKRLLSFVSKVARNVSFHWLICIELGFLMLESQTTIP